MKTMRVRMLRMKGWRRPIQTWRTNATSGRFYSTARRSSFVCQAEAAQAVPDRDAVGLDAMPIAQFDHQFIKGQVELFPEPTGDPVRQARQLAVPTSVAMALGLKRTRRTLQMHHVIPELDRNAEMSRRNPMRVTLFDTINEALTKLHRKWLAHNSLPTSAIRRRNQKSYVMEIPNRNGRNLL